MGTGNSAPLSSLICPLRAGDHVSYYRKATCSAVTAETLSRARRCNTVQHGATRAYPTPPTDSTAGNWREWSGLESAAAAAAALGFQVTPHTSASAQLCSLWAVARGPVRAAAALEWNSGVCVWGLGEVAEESPRLKNAQLS